MLRLVVFLAFLAAVVYAVFWLIDRRAASSQQHRVRATDPASGAGDDGYPTVEAQVATAAQAATGTLKPRTLAIVPPSIALRSSSGTPANCLSFSSRLPRNVPSACG